MPILTTRHIMPWLRMAYLACPMQSVVKGLARVIKFPHHRYLQNNITTNCSHYVSLCSIHSAVPDNKQQLATNFDPRLRTFLLEVKDKLDTSGYLSIQTNAGKLHIDTHHIQAIAGLAGKLIQVENDFNELKALSDGDDKNIDLTTMIQEEFVQLEETMTHIQNEVLDLILLQDGTQTEGIIMEFSAGVGGQEAMLFCSELLGMYCIFCEKEGWDHELTDHEKSDLEGVRRAVLNINHPEAYGKLRFESGVHRVQRVPKTEKSGRIHTSTVAVAILPRPSEVTITIEQKDLKIETKRASGAGGQHVNTTESAVRITHLPSGMVAECQTQRSQMQNRKVAIDKLRARLFQMNIDKQQASTRSSRKLQVGSSGRSEKIRTYNFPQDRITDHRINFTSHNLEDFLIAEKPFETLLERLREESRRERLIEFLEQVKVSCD